MENTLQIDDKYALVFGMDWTVLDPLSPKHEQIAELQANGAKWQAKFKQNGEENFGTISEITQFPGKVKVLSGAAQVSVMEQFSGKTVLVMLEEGGDHQGNAGFIATVGLINGNVALDAMLSSEDAKQARATFHDRCESANLQYVTAGYAHSIEPMEIPLEWADLLPAKISKFKKSPEMVVTPLRSGILTRFGGIGFALILIGAATWWGYSQYAAYQAKKKAAAAAQALNPEILYEASSRAFLDQPKVLAKDAFPEIRQAIGAMPTKLAGWKLRKVDCNKTSCELSWERAGGTFAEFKKAAPTQWTDFEYSDDGRALHNKLAVKLKTQKLPDRSKWLPKSSFLLNEGSKWQLLSDINLSPMLGAIKLEALPPGVSPSAVEQSPYAIRSAQWTIRPGSSWFASEGFDTSPEFVTYDSMILNISDNDITFEAKGNVYVK